MLGIERRREIMKLLNQHQKVYVQDLSKLFDVTDETIRRDLEKLEQQNLVKRCYGGAVINDHTSQDISFLKRIDINQVFSFFSYINLITIINIYAL